MFLNEPPQTNYDLRFSLAGFPVRVHPFFWLVAILLGGGGTRGGEFNDHAGAELLIWVAILFGSILIHELGHALAFRWYGLSTRIVMYMFGGLAIPDVVTNPWQRRPQLDYRANMMVSLAGPAAGFVLAAFVIAAIPALHGVFEVDLHNYPGFHITVPPDANSLVWYAVANLLVVNIFWGLLNLLPIFPLDGGQVVHAYLTAKDPAGQLKAQQISFFTALIAAILGLVSHNLFMALLFGSLAYSSFMAMRFTGGGFGGRPW